MSKTFALKDRVLCVGRSHSLSDAAPSSIVGAFGVVIETPEDGEPGYRVHFGPKIGLWYVHPTDLEHAPSTDATAKQVGAYAHLSAKLHAIGTHGAAEDVETLGGWLISAGAPGTVRDAFERLADAYLDVVERARPDEREQKERRDRFVLAALSGERACTAYNPQAIAEYAVKVADATIAELDDTLPLIEELREDVERLKRWQGYDKTGLYEHAHEDTIPEPATPETTRKRLEQLVAIVKAAEAEGINPSANHLLTMALLAPCKELMAVFARAEAKETRVEPRFKVGGFAVCRERSAGGITYNLTNGRAYEILAIDDPHLPNPDDWHLWVIDDGGERVGPGAYRFEPAAQPSAKGDGDV